MELNKPHLCISRTGWFCITADNMPAAPATYFNWEMYDDHAVCPGVSAAHKYDRAIRLILEDAAIIAGGEFSMSPEVAEIVMARLA